MKRLFIEAKYTGRINVSRIKAEKLPLKIGLVASVQFVDFLNEIKEFLEKKGKRVFIENGAQRYPGQVLGCEQSAARKISALVDAFLYIGDGRFHAIGIRLDTGKDVYIFDPVSGEFEKIEKKETEKIKMRRKAQLIKFLSSREIGVIISCKQGQYKLAEAKKLKERYPEKNFYWILLDNVDYPQLENFSFIESWVNTACPRIEEDIKVLNLRDIR